MKSHATLICACFALLVAGSATAQEGRAETGTSSVAEIVSVLGIQVPDSALARDAAKTIRDSEGELLFQHSMRLYWWAALAGGRKGMAFDHELLYVAAMFHDYGLTENYGDSHLR
ncbi:hypothetical protein CT676_38110 [Bradyrhizobium sp. MOS001]|uniref:hypothetical protein n=1 Tax=unclassified Bradyrhizobium TaxID=2631580 RepID=UPI001074B6B0|nr:hypothetical protein [Bradyrhizobium sp. MOS001]TFW55881.1 hypothetical protein CT676_38110 [Bradyrhizobium sp. MOS001]